MNTLRKKLVGLLLISVLGGCVAAECRDGSHEEGGKCVSDSAGEGGSSGESGEGGTSGEGGNAGDAGSGGTSGSGGTAGEGGSAGVGGDEDAGFEVDAGNDSGANDGGQDASEPDASEHDAEVVDAGMVPLVCGSGFEPDGLGGCRDIDECVTTPCGANATCTNNEGAYACACNSGFSGNGFSCADINECDLNNGGCDLLTMCTNTVGARECGACPSGYAGMGATGCVEINECVDNTDNCDNDPAATCNNVAGSYTCSCPGGFQGTGVGSNGCADINECNSGNGGCDTMPMVTCTNTTGGRSCGACPSGYTGSGVGSNGCQDVNECLTNNGGCDAAAQCTNTTGGRTCGACPAGYTGNGSLANVCVPQLASLRTTPGLTAAFAAGTTSYSMVAGLFLSFVEVVATTALVGATIQVGGVAVDARGRVFHAVAADPTASIPVTVRDTYGRTATYTINMTRAGDPTQRAYIKSPASAGSNQYFAMGLRVAMSGDTLAVSHVAPGLYGGAVEIYVRSGDSWSHQATLDPLTFDPSRLTNGFGRTGLDLDGDVLVVGDVSYPASDGDLVGAAHVFRRTGTTWAREATLTRGIYQDAGDNFGWSVGVSGDTVVIGAPNEDGGTFQPSNNSASDAGAVFVYERVNGAWTESDFLKATVARPGNDPNFEVRPGAGDQFGYDVDIVGDTLLISAPFEDSAAVGVNQAYALSSTDSGAVYTFVRREDDRLTWDWQSYVKATSGAAANLQFGRSVSMATEQSFAVGAAGQAYVFHAATLGAWTEARRLTSGSQDADDFGAEVAMWGPGMVIVSAAGDDSSFVPVGGALNNDQSNSGAAYVFTASRATWSASPTRRTLKAMNAEADDGVTGSTFTRVALWGDVAIMTAPGEDSSVTGVHLPGPTADTDTDVSVNYGAGAAYSFR